jgi:uncharacterized protein
MAQGEGPVQRLTPDECWALLGTSGVGRLAFGPPERLELLPVNYLVDGGALLFRTGPGTKLDTFESIDRVLLEADGYDDPVAWSVVVRGRAGVLTDPVAVARAESLPLRPWIPTLKAVHVRIVPDEITGRRFERGPEPAFG